MEITLIDIGNSKGIRLNKSLLNQIDFTDKANIEVVDKKLIITPIKKKARQGWAEAIKQAQQKQHSEDKISPLIYTNDEFDKTWEW